MHMRVNIKIEEYFIKLLDWYFYWMNFVKNVRQKFDMIKSILLIVKWTFSECFMSASSLDCFCIKAPELSN